MKLKLALCLLLAALTLAPSSFGLKTATTGTATCSGNSVALNYDNGPGYNNSTGQTIPFSIDVSVSGGTISSPTCSGGYAIYSVSGDPFTVTFSAPIITGDSTVYTDVSEVNSGTYQGLNYYNGLFGFDDNTSTVSFIDNLLSVATSSTGETGQFALADGGEEMTFDPAQVSTLVIYGNGGVPAIPTPEPGSLLLISSALGGLALMRRKLSV